MWRKLFNLKFWIPIILLGIGGSVAFEMIKNKPTARKKPNFKRGKLVEVMEANFSNPKIEIRTHGRITPAQKVVLSARTSGEVIWISPKLNEGIFFKKGQHLLSIGIRQSQSRLKAPFNGVVQSKNVDLGQFVNVGTKLATLIGSELAEVKIDIPMSRLNWLSNKSINRPSGKIKKDDYYKIPANISLSGINSKTFWPAIIKRHLLELNPRGMMVQLIAEVKDPFLLGRKERIRVRKNNKESIIKGGKIKNVQSEYKGSKSFREIPLFVGAFVDVHIPGRQLENVVQIPARALRDRDTVWIAMGNELKIRSVKIAHVDLDNVYLSAGVVPGEKIIISPLKGASNGLKVKLYGDIDTKEIKYGGRKKGKKFRNN
tara:strand:+ start:112 stop:1230 length:1119 start_codon:yes stop_codon:yes gene_type:complete